MSTCTRSPRSILLATKTAGSWRGLGSKTGSVIGGQRVAASSRAPGAGGVPDPRVQSREPLCLRCAGSSYAALAPPGRGVLTMLCGGCSTSCIRCIQLRHASKVYGRAGSYTSTIAAPPCRVRHSASGQHTAPLHHLQPYTSEATTPLGAGRTFHRPGSISVKRSCPPVSKRCSSTLTSESGMGTCFEQNSAPHVIWYVFGNFAPEELNICTRAVLPTAGSPACAARALANHEEVQGGG